MKNISIHLIAYAAGAAMAFLAIIMFASPFTHASAPTGLAASMYNASSTQQVVTGTQGIISATSTNCAARIVSTASTSVMLTFSDLNSAGVVPTGLNGVYQAASTTVAYDGGVYGCGALRALAGGGAGGLVTVLLTY